MLRHRALALKHFGAMQPPLRHPAPRRLARGVAREFCHLLAVGGVSKELVGRINGRQVHARASPNQSSGLRGSLLNASPCGGTVRRDRKAATSTMPVPAMPSSRRHRANSPPIAGNRSHVADMHPVRSWHLPDLPPYLNGFNGDPGGRFLAHNTRRPPRIKCGAPATAPFQPGSSWRRGRNNASLSGRADLPGRRADLVCPAAGRFSVEGGDVALYVDDAIWRWQGLQWAHLLADSIDELHRFAADLGINRLSYQGPPRTSVPHYDLTAYERRRAIARGAIACSRHEIVVVLRRACSEHRLARMRDTRSRRARIGAAASAVRRGTQDLRWAQRRVSRRANRGAWYFAWLPCRRAHRPA